MRVQKPKLSKSQLKFEIAPTNFQFWNYFSKGKRHCQVVNLNANSPFLQKLNIFICDISRKFLGQVDSFLFSEIQLAI